MMDDSPVLDVHIDHAAAILVQGCGERHRKEVSASEQGCMRQPSQSLRASEASLNVLGSVLTSKRHYLSWSTTLTE